MKLRYGFLFLFLIFSQQVYAGSGAAILPHWSADSSTNSSTIVYISNISDNLINIEVKFYDDNGVVVPADIYTNLINGNSQLQANATGQIQIKPPSRKTGYAVIEWSNINDDNDVVAVVASALRVSVNTSSRRSDVFIPVNDGAPF